MACAEDCTQIVLTENGNYGYFSILSGLCLRSSLFSYPPDPAIFMRLLALLTTAAILFAPASTADETLDLRTPDSRNHLLVLNSGRVVKGRLTPRTGGYDVTLPAGRMFVSSEQIRFKAANMNDAYQRLRDSFTELTPNSHMELARWCMTNKLLSMARRELLDALHLDPYHTQARRMLEGIVREQARTPQQQAPASAVIDPFAPERRSLGGLTQDTARVFTRNIQPLLTNKCGNARCHGAGQNGFAVVPAHNSVTAYTTEQNLAAVLNQIDFRNPAASPLMSAVTGVHGGSRELLFRGQSGRRQLDLLKQWIAAVAREVSPPRETVDGTAKIHPRQQTETRAADSNISTAARTQAVSDSRFITDAVAATKTDQFDPEKFNKRFHPQSRTATVTEPR